MNVRRAQSTPFLPSLALAAVAWLALFGALALPATTQAQTETETTLVSNIKQGNTGSKRILQSRLALTFITGPNTSRYILSNVEVVSDDADGTPFDISLCTVDSDAQPTSNCKELDGPGSFPAGTLSFDVPPAVTNFHGDGNPTFIWHTLAPNKTYVLLFHTFSTVDLGATTNDGEDEGHEEGWTIGNAYLYEIFGTGWVADTSGESFRIAIKGYPATAELDTYPLESTDATLSALVVEDGTSDLTLTPTFAPGTTSYAVSVGYAVDEVTVKPSKSDDNATVEYLDASDNALADADATERGQQAALAVGENTIKVKVTAEDRPTTQTYTVTVTRAAETTPANLTAEAVAPMRVTLEWDRTLPSLTGTIDRDDGYKIEWSPDGSAPWTSLVNYTNQHGTFDIWCTCYPTRFNDDTITPGTTRHYRVKAVDDDDESAWSDVVSATTPVLVDSYGGQIQFGAVVSELDALNDQKVFRIDLESGEYRFMIRGKAPKHRVIVTDQGGTEIENFVLVAGNGLSPRITAESPGIHQVKISHGGGFGNAGGGGLNAGWFQFQLVPVSDPAVGTLRLPDTPNLPAVLSTYGDVDRAELAVQPGKAYAVRVRGRETGHGTAATPRIKRVLPPSTNHEHNMGKPWVEGVTTAKASPICPGFSEPEKCEFQAFVIDLRGQTGAEQTWRIIVAPTARPRTWPYRVGTYQVDLRELSSSQLAGVRMPLRAWFASQPTQHDGSTRIKVRIAFSDAVDESPENVGEHGVSVDGGEVTSVRPMDGQATGGSKASKGARSAGGQGDDAEDREVVWEIEIKPDSDEDVTVSLAAWSPCDEPGAFCTADGRTLSTAISTTVRGPDEAAAPEPPDKPKGLSATASHDSVTLTWDDPADDSITGYVILRRNRDTDRKGEFRELAADTGTAATTYTDGTVSAETRYTYRIKAINEHGVSERSRWFHIATPAAPEQETPPERANSPTTGAPAITGTAQVGETLTANTSGIGDADGLSSVRYEYQWLADDSDISGATNATYTLAADDEGKTIKVRASFADDLGNDEARTSAATDTVAAAPTPNTPATGAPTITGTAQVGETLTANTSGIADEDGLEDATFSYEWLADGTAVSGATASAYTPVAADEGKAIKVEVSFTDDAGNGESLTSAATAAVAAEPAEPPDKPRGLSATASHGQVVLTWDDPQDNSITGYVILRRVRVNDQGGDFDVLVADTGTAALTYTDDTVAASTTYTYRIKAINEHGASERSRWYHIDTPAAP